MNQAPEHQIPSLQRRSQERDSEHLSCWDKGSDCRHIYQTLGRRTLQKIEGKVDGMVVMITLYRYNEMRECDDNIKMIW
jgi:hypothetical protein